MNVFKLIIMIFLSFNCFAQENTKSEKESEVLVQENILKRVQQLKGHSIEKFILEMRKLNKDIQNFVSNEKEACSQLHTTQVLEQDNLKKPHKRKLSKKEKMYCKLLIVKFQIKMNHLIYSAREVKLKEEHQSQLKRLDEEYKNRIVELESIAEKLK